MIRDNLRVRLYLRLLSVEKGKKMSNARLMTQLAFHQVLQLIGFGFHAGISQ